MRRWRGLQALVHDSVDAVTWLVGLGHASTARTIVTAVSTVPGLAGPVRVVDAVRDVVTEGTLGTVRVVNRLVQSGSGLALDIAGVEDDEGPPIALRSDVTGTAAWVGDALLGAVNGVVGDHLHTSENGLSLGMTLRRADGAVGATIVVLVHGLATTEWSWALDTGRHLGDPSATFGELLRRDLGYTPVYARYNTGRHVSENGRLLAAALERLLAEWPVPVEDVVLLGHSMGGLVIRSATLLARDGRQEWLSHVSRIVCLGTPHHGAPLERFGHALAGVLERVDLPATRIPAAILRARSAGIKDLRHGHVRDEQWEGRDLDAFGLPGHPPPKDAAAVDVPALSDNGLVDGIAYAFFAGSVTGDPTDRVSGALGDLLVPVPSAEGPSAGLVSVRRRRIPGVLHHELQVHPAAYDAVLEFLAGSAPSASAPSASEGPSPPADTPTG